MYTGSGVKMSEMSKVLILLALAVASHSVSIFPASELDYDGWVELLVLRGRQSMCNGSMDVSGLVVDSQGSGDLIQNYVDVFPSCNGYTMDHQVLQFGVLLHLHHLSPSAGHKLCSTFYRCSRPDCGILFPAAHSPPLQRSALFVSLRAMPAMQIDMFAGKRSLRRSPGCSPSSGTGSNFSDS